MGFESDYQRRRWETKEYAGGRRGQKRCVGSMEESGMIKRGSQSEFMGSDRKHESRCRREEKNAQQSYFDNRGPIIADDPFEDVDVRLARKMHKLYVGLQSRAAVMQRDRERCDFERQFENGSKFVFSKVLIDKIVESFMHDTQTQIMNNTSGRPDESWCGRVPNGRLMVGVPAVFRS